MSRLKQILYEFMPVILMVGGMFGLIFLLMNDITDYARLAEIKAERCFAQYQTIEHTTVNNKIYCKVNGLYEVLND